MSMTQLLFSFQGRLNRKPWWLTNIAVAVGVIVLLLLALAWSESTSSPSLPDHGTSRSFSTFRCSGSVSPRGQASARPRQVGVVARPVLSGSGIASGIGDQMDSMGLVLHLVAFAITVWAFVELGCLRGTVGPNRYGPDPLAPVALGPPAPRDRTLTRACRTAKAAAMNVRTADPAALARDLLRCPRSRRRKAARSA